MAFLLPDRRADRHRREFHRQKGFLALTGSVTEADPVYAAGSDIVHHLRDGRAATLGKAAHTTPDEKVRSQILCQTEEFIDVAPAVTDVDAAFR